MSEELRRQRERVQNVWNSVARKLPALANATRIHPEAEVDFDDIGGLHAAKEELLTFACAATDPDVYGRWGTLPPSGLLLIGHRGVGKKLLAHALARQTGRPFLRVVVPRLVADVLHFGGNAGELLGGWRDAMAELEGLTVFFDELEFSEARDRGTQRTDLPIGQIMDFLLELVDRTIAAEGVQVVGSTAYPRTLRPAFVAPGRFERVVEVAPIVPDDVVAALLIHTAAAEKRAGRSLFEGEIDWTDVVNRYRQAPTGDFVRILHGVLRRKARCDAAGEPVGPVTTEDLIHEVERARHADTRLAPPGGTYL